MSTKTPFFADQSAVALIAFTPDAKIIQYKKVNREPSQSTVQTAVKMFVSSRSITEALFASPKPNTRAWDEALPERDNHHTASITLEDGGLFVASRIQNDAWLGVLFAHCIVHDNEVVDAIIPALVCAAEDLVVSAVRDVNEIKGVGAKPFSLWLAMLEGVTSASQWNRDKRAVHIRMALIALAERHMKYQVSPPLAVDDLAQREHYIQPFAAEFRSQVAKAAGNAPDALCILSDSTTIWYSDNMTKRQEQSVQWYFAYIIRHGSRISSRYVFELDDHSMVRLWYAKRGLTLYTHLNPKESTTERTYKSLGQVALDVLRAVEEYIPSSALSEAKS